MANQNPETPPKKYDIASLEGEEIIERKTPSGYTAKYIKLHGHWKALDLVVSGFIPDPRSHVPEVRQMEVFDDDVFIYAYPKCGTHWVWEMIFMLQRGKAEYDKRPKEVAMLEFHSLDKLCEEERPRVFNTHLYPNEVPTASLEGKGKALILLRNPKDIAVSFFNHIEDLKIKTSKMTWEDWMYFFNKYGGRIDWFEYTKEWENESKKKKRTYLCLYYEQMKKNPLATVKSVADYLGIPCTDALAEEIVHKCKIENLRVANREKFDHRNQSGPNPEMNDPDKMYRKGEVGDWKNWFTVAQSEEFDRVFKTRMADSKFKFTYE
ncbi:sulfotransferase 1B1-like isoform X1 [Saccostrea cucullata]|uniref:sulfotransferase 1B1-like isoform X1 n=1 Tax=Saccostrea cuccullata TaxID=36930 RepID=UPI002ED66AB8